VKDIPNYPEKLLIDVREPGELAAEGKIPFSINIPREFIMSTQSAVTVQQLSIPRPTALSENSRGKSEIKRRSFLQQVRVGEADSRNGNDFPL
jgi:hypothetical protein